MSYVALGFNPAPGDAAAGATMVRTLRNAADALGEIDSVLSGNGDQQWQGRTAESFRELMDDDLQPRIAEAHASFDEATRALDSWVRVLPTYQSRADSLERRAQAALDTVASAEATVSTTTTAPAGETETERADRERELANHRSALSGSQQELAAIRSEAQSLLDEVDGVATATARALNTAMQHAPDEPGFWDRVGGVLSGIGDLLGSFGDILADAFDWFMENVLPVLQKLTQIIGAVATVLSIVAFLVSFVFPPAAAFAATMAAVGRAAAIANMAMDGLRVLHGEEGALGDLLVGGLSFGAGRLLGPVSARVSENLRMGQLVPALAGTARGGGGAAVGTLGLQFNNNFLPSLFYWSATSARDLKGSFDTIYDQSWQR